MNFSIRTAASIFASSIIVLSLSLGAQVAPAEKGTSPSSASTWSPIEQPGRQMEFSDIEAAQVLHVFVGRSMMLRANAPMRRIYVGNPAVLQSFTASPREIVLTAKTAGISSLVVWDGEGGSRLYTVAADVDPQALRQSLREAYPKSQIDVEGREGRIYLTGSVPTQDVADGAAKLSSSYTKELVSSLRVVPIHGKQVQLKLRIVEVDRTRMEQYGINIFAGGKDPLATSTGQFPSTTTLPTAGGTAGTSSTIAVSDPLNLFLYSNALSLGATIKDLEQKQILQVLAEPTLTTISGQPAKFLSGGEFPFPVVQGGTGTGVAVTIQFRPYGVKVEFTPIVNDDGSIRLKVAPEVSTLDFSNAVSISGFTIPALSSRRAETEVEIQSGQSFAVSGLLDHRTTESLSQLPGISSIPILGKLFVSKAYTHSVVELVVLVTATVVDPLSSPAKAVEPEMAVPNMDKQAFDLMLTKEQKVKPKQP